jgi:hypothetical protein
MKKYLISATILINTLLSGCTAITITSIGSTVATGQSLTEIAASHITNADCSWIRYLTDHDRHSYYCEQARTESNSYPKSW